MRYKLLGRSGLRVSELALGTMTFGEDWGWGASKEESRRIFDAYCEAGGNFIDTANHYTGGTSERFVGEFVAADRERFVVATKYTLNGRPTDPNGGGNHRKSMVHAVEGSLKRLHTDYIDLYWVHAWDFLTPVEETMRALDDVVRAGKVLYVGISDTPAWVVSRANTMAELRGWSPFVALQIEYSLIQRTPERDLLPMADALELTVTPWGVLGGGVLTGKYNAGGEEAKGARLAQGPMADAYRTDRNLTISAEVGRVAQELGATASQVSLAWMRQQPGTMVPILGARRMAQLQDNLASLELTLPAEQVSRLDRLSRVELGFPHDFLRQPMVEQLIHGGTLSSIDSDRRRGFARREER
ncbi:MAG: aldo/keto reductase [Deltaproteobacteria bacterium CG_4_10_14_3_um_filter_60_8]|nr:MAG: aldo/keto reductase [Deltaproteobacteria bacterium CG_4_10_14_3_um_filter_60_8]